MTVTLVANRVKYYSMGDERMFFGWLKNIGGIQKIHGVGTELHIVIRTEELSVQDIPELIAVFRRYRITLEQLAQLRVPENNEWFESNRKKVWYRRLFPDERA